MTPPRVRHRLIIRHPSGSTILFVNATGAPRLPSFVSEDHHTADVDYINAAAREQLGLHTTVLRSHWHSEVRHGVVDRVHELVVHGPVPAGLAWCRRDATSSCVPDDADAIAIWLAAPDEVIDGAEWMRPGWFEEVSGWVHRTLGDVTAIVQVRSWMSSCVLRVQTAAGASYYFKAVTDSGRVECPITAYLAQHFPNIVARVVATEPKRRWLLMEALPGASLENIQDAVTWETAAAGYARLQAACVQRVVDLRLLGCQTRTLGAIADGIGLLASDVGALRSGAPDGLTSVEASRFRSIGNALRERCAALAALDIPLTLEHGDLWPSNFLVADGAFALIDWEDVAIGHPFVSLAPFLAGLGLSQPRLHSRGLVDRIERAYLTGFAGEAPSALLRKALRLATPLAFVDLALRYRRQRPSVVGLHPWMSELVPQAMRLALNALEGDAG
jgi:hypothetical protein